MNRKTPLVPFQAGSPIMDAGPTASGKTYWTNRLLSNNMFTQPISSILYCYGVWQDYFEQIKIPNLEFHDGLPSIEKVKSLHDGKLHIIVLDDPMEHIVKSIETQKFIHKILPSLKYNSNFSYSKYLCSRTLF